MIITKITSPRENQRAQLLTNVKHEEGDYRVACNSKSSMIAAAIITYTGEFLLTYVSPTGTNIWGVSYHPERLDINADGAGGFCSVGFSEYRALALDRKGNLLAMDVFLASE